MGWYLNEDELSNSDGITAYEYQGEETTTDEIYLAVQDPNCIQPIYSDTVTIMVDESPKVSAGEDVEVQTDQSITLNGSVSPSSAVIEWDSPIAIAVGQGTVTPTLLALGAESEIIIAVTATEGKCTAKDEMTLTITTDVEIFTSFSPNGDQVNDLWTINGIQKYPETIVKVFNRWGQEVYMSDKGYTTKWNGRSGNKPLPVGTYYYVISLIGEGQVNRELSGSITIVR